MYDGVPPPGRDGQDLERALVDERAERAKAQRRAAEATEATRVWRERAEARAERIRRLEAERDHLRTASGWLRSRLGRTSSRAETTVAAPSANLIAPSARPSFPGVRIASNATGSVGRIAAEAATVTLTPDVLDAVDLVVFDPGAAEDGLHAEVTRWASESARVPLVVVGATSGIGDLAIDHDGGLALPETIDPTRDVPGPEAPHTSAEFDGALRGDDGRLIAAVARLGPQTRGPVVHLAARGLPVVDEATGVVDRAAGARARRWAWAHRDPAAWLPTLLDDAGVSWHRPSRSVAGILVSNRADRITGAIDAFAAQTYGDRELVVGCHGIDPEPVESHLRSTHPDLAAIVVGFGTDRSLGSCLNASIEETRAPILAKIDDDDHYGPNYLLDAVQALRYSGSEVVGKYCHFTHLPSGETLVRRPGAENSLIAGMPPGGSLVFTRNVWQRVGFPDRPRKVDLFFVEGARAAGFDVFSGERWEFTYVRHAGDHTWSVDEAALRAGAEHAWDGWRPTRADA